jgi:hypothetical protein
MDKIICVNSIVRLEYVMSINLENVHNMMDLKFLITSIKY